MAKKPAWSRLDNVGKLFPSVHSHRLTNLFRLSVTLTESVSRGLLQEALEDILPRFPYFQAKIRRGWFWYSLVHDDKIPQVILDGAYPCMPLKKDIPELQMFRIRYYGRRIALEINHVLTDGTGALEFLKAILGQYFYLKKGLEAGDMIKNAAQSPEEGEWEDSFALRNELGLPAPPPLKRAFLLPWKRVPKGQYYVVTGYLPVKEVKKTAGALGLTLTEFLLGKLFRSFLSLQEDILAHRTGKPQPVTIFLPVNLRPYFGSKTMRNFFLTVPLTVDPRLGSYTEEEIYQEVRLQTALETDRHRLVQRIAHNRRGEVIPAVRIFPLFLKNWVIGAAFSAGSKMNSGSFSNLGLVKVPEAWTPWIRSFEFIPPPNPINKTAVSVITWEDTLAVSFGRMVGEPELERRFFTFLRKAGLPVRIESNFGE